jgi:chromosome segregation ATPase
MSTSPLNPVFGDEPKIGESLQRFPAPVHELANGPQSAPGNGVDVGPTNAEIHSIATAIEELQIRLERANGQLGQATAVRTTELEIGRLFVEAQRFSEKSLTKLEQQIQEILVEAESKAIQILREATEDAHEIRRQAQESASISARAAQELQAAISGFTVVNSALVNELTALNTMLTPPAEQRFKTFDHSSGETKNT